MAGALCSSGRMVLCCSVCGRQRLAGSVGSRSVPAGPAAPLLGRAGGGACSPRRVHLPCCRPSRLGATQFGALLLDARVSGLLACPWRAGPAVAGDGSSRCGLGRLQVVWRLRPRGAAWGDLHCCSQQLSCRQAPLGLGALGAGGSFLFNTL